MGKRTICVHRLPLREIKKRIFVTGVFGAYVVHANSVISSGAREVNLELSFGDYVMARDVCAFLRDREYAARLMADALSDHAEAAGRMASADPRLDGLPGVKP